MTKVKTKSEQEFDRTEILRYLNECGLQPVTPKSILIYLDDCLRPVSLSAVEFHLRYMRDREWVELGIEKKGMAEVQFDEIEKLIGAVIDVGSPKS